MSDRRNHRWTEEDSAYAAAQWASGIKQSDIAKAFGHRNAAMVCMKIAEFLRDNTAADVWQTHFYPSERRQLLVKPALARFVQARNQRMGAS